MAAATDGGGVGGDRRRSRRGSLALPPSSISSNRPSARPEQQGRAFVALAHVVADAGGGGWPEQMTRDLQACRTPQERNAWAEKWGKVLSGEARAREAGSAGATDARQGSGWRVSAVVSVPQRFHLSPKRLSLQLWAGGR